MNYRNHNKELFITGVLLFTMASVSMVLIWLIMQL